MKLSKLFRFLLPGLNMGRSYIDDPGAGGGTTPPASKPGPQTFSLEYVTELREENKSWRLKHTELTAKLAEATAAVDKATKEADTKIADATKATDARILRSELKAHALKAGLVDADALALADLSTVKLNDKGEVEGAEALFTSLKAAKPYLFGTPGTSSTVTPPAGTPPAAKKATEITDPKERAKFQADFLAANK